MYIHIGYTNNQLLHITCIDILFAYVHIGYTNNQLLQLFVCYIHVGYTNNNIW